MGIYIKGMEMPKKKKGEAIEFFKRKLTLRSNATEDDLVASYFALDALELQVPKEPTFVKVLYDKHDWKKEKDGSIDEFGLDFGFHNGPICSRCYYSFCMHCVSDYEAEQRIACTLAPCATISPFQKRRTARSAGRKWRITAMSDFEIRPCGSGWAYCDGNCANCKQTSATYSTSTNK